jgi:outer membrane protein OmpA-like peptidoglycan-associated protein
MTHAATLPIVSFAVASFLTSGALAQAKAPDSLVLYFDSGSVAVGKEGQATLDQASRLYRDGKPIVMVVSGSADAVGPAAANLKLSQQRADAVLRGLIARGIPAERFQVLAKGETEPAVPATKGVAEPRNRRVEITIR